MRVFLSEYLTSGALDDELSVEPSLAAEGGAMLRALASDAASMPGWQVTVLWNGNLEAFGVAGVKVCCVRSANEERELFDRLSSLADATLAIAPEFDGLLEGRCRRVAAAGGRWVGSDAGAIARCADKLELASFLMTRGIPTIETQLCDFSKVVAAIGDWPPGGLIIKPRYGAGSTHTFHVRTRTDLEVASIAFERPGSFGEAIVQPYVGGTAVSIAGVATSRGIELFPACRQRIDGQTQLHYAGGVVPLDDPWYATVVEVARQASSAIEGLVGYFGIDLIVPDDHSHHPRPLVVEINPRLTSSYHGYRRLTDENLAARLLDPQRLRPLVAWKSMQVEYRPDGSVTDVLFAKKSSDR